MRIYKVDEILKELVGAIATDAPFSLIRFGDGGLKLIHCLVTGDDEFLEMIIEKEGIPKYKLPQVLDLWGYYARQANFIDCPEVYYDGSFWPRIKRLGTEISRETNSLLLDWHDLYTRAELDNDRYCNPEVNYLMTVDRAIIKGSLTLPAVMRNRKVCFISARSGLVNRFKRYTTDVTVKQIVEQYQNHYTVCFDLTMEYISKRAKVYDFWLVAAGELGRIYTGYIKECGGRAVDIGFVADFWDGEPIHTRLSHFIQQSADPLLTILTEDGRDYLYDM